MSESYWAAISSLIVIQSSAAEAWTVAARRFIGTALGASLGALLATHFGADVAAYGAGIFVVTILGALLGRIHRRVPEYLDASAVRYGTVALTIVMLVARYNSPWIVAMHRFIEVSIGIGVALALTVLWPEVKPSEESP